MKKKICVLALVAMGCTCGCTATLHPGGTLQTHYYVPVVTEPAVVVETSPVVVVETHHPVTRPFAPLLVSYRSPAPHPAPLKRPVVKPKHHKIVPSPLKPAQPSNHHAGHSGKQGNKHVSNHVSNHGGGNNHSVGHGNGNSHGGGGGHGGHK